MDITPWEAALGAKVVVPTVDGRISLTVPAGSQSGQTLRVHGKGMPIATGRYGDLLVNLRIVVPGITIHELSRLSECHLTVAKRLFSIGLIEPLSAGATPLFDRSAVVRARKALRLKRDLGLNFDAVALVMELLDRIDDLERRL